MNILDGIILGVVQGLTEFLPVSSSGHLIIARDLFGISADYGLAVDAMLHLATACAVLIYFRTDFRNLFMTAVRREHSPLLYATLLGTIPAVIAGLLLEDYMATTFRSAELVAWTLIAGSALFMVAEYVAAQYAKQGLRHDISPRRGLLIGLFQALALIPGMSRSGATISGGLLLGLSREEAARFGFLLSFPIILGSGLKKAIELSATGVNGEFGLALFISAAVAFSVGLLAIHYLLKFLRTHTLMVFVAYRVFLAIVVLVIL